VSVLWGIIIKIGAGFAALGIRRADFGAF